MNVSYKFVNTFVLHAVNGAEAATLELFVYYKLFQLRFMCVSYPAVNN